MMGITSDRHRSSAAERMRLARQRRREGLRCLTIELHEDDIEALTRRGLLAPEQRHDRDAVLAAIYALLDEVLAA